jgi:hypothetical protein
MQSRRIAVTVPEPVLDALYAEGSRTYETVGQVAARVLREALPDYVGRSLRRDLAPAIRARVLDARPAPADDPISDAQRPGLNPGRASDPATDAEAIVSPSAAPRGDGATAAR